MTAAVMQTVLKKVRAHRTYRVAMRLRSLSLPNMRPVRFRRLWS